MQGVKIIARLPTPLPILPRKGGGIMAQSREGGVDVVAARVPKAAPARGFEAVRNRGGGLRIFAQQKVAHRGVRHIGVVQEIEQLARHRAGGFGESDQAVDRLGQVRRRRDSRAAFARR